MKLWKYGNALIGILLSAFACNAEPMRDNYIPRWREFLKTAETGHRASTLDLAGDGWRLEGKGEGNHGEIALPIRVPCDVQTALFDAGKHLRATY